MVQATDGNGASSAEVQIDRLPRADTLLGCDDALNSTGPRITPEPSANHSAPGSFQYSLVASHRQNGRLEDDRPEPCPAAHVNGIVGNA
jgi:hypothetical protein